MIDKFVKKDWLLLAAFLIVTYIMVIYATIQGMDSIGGAGAVLMVVAAVLCLSAITVCFIVVALHLKNNKEDVYKGELE